MIEAQAKQFSQPTLEHLRLEMREMRYPQFCQHKVSLKVWGVCLPQQSYRQHDIMIIVD